MIKNDLKITVLMSIYNEREGFLKRSISSILIQTFRDFEFLIIDDGSTDKKTIEVLNKYARENIQIRIIRNEKNIGLVQSLNKGMIEAKGKYIARIDGDDIAYSHRLEKQLDFMEKNPNYALCGSWSYIINQDDEIMGGKKFFSDYKKIRKNLIYFNFFTHSSLFFRKNLALENKGYNEKIKKAQDYDFIFRISAHHPIANIPEFLCFHRIHPDSISAKGKKKQEWYGLVARWRAIWSYGYPKTYILKIIPSLFYFLLIPFFIEKKLLKLFWNNNV